ncbi:uncharacterized protein LOC118182793 isoform X2 [Stegodyphus dumicola]|uniref:uncharacterized protein LOC118182793 isoform X2 n=1 Tax=Stegodyphus dumicola TaxID=202533 RepID=UPI0015AEC1BB|nr:uncharacterized protein LOC118182793 isoform X2 [Stegodyphus dumicola]
MENNFEQWLTAICFEHAYILDDEDIASKILLCCSKTKIENSEAPAIKPVFLLIYFLRKLLQSLDSFAKEKKYFNILWNPRAVTLTIQLLESIYVKNNFISLKKYFTLISELKLLDLLNLIQENADSSHIIQKLNKHFPRWNTSYKSLIEKDYSIENPKILVKVEESHTQCRRLVLKLAVDQVYRRNYMLEEYSNDVEKLISESKLYITDVITSFIKHAGSSVLERVMSGDDDLCQSASFEMQLLLDYFQDDMSDEELLKLLQDLKPTMHSQPTCGLVSCLRPIDTMSEMTDSCPEMDTEESSEDESSQSIGTPKSFMSALPRDTPRS